MNEGGYLFNATLKTLKLYRDGQFYWWMKPEFPRKPTYCSKFLT